MDAVILYSKMGATSHSPNRPAPGILPLGLHAILVKVQEVGVVCVVFIVRNADYIIYAPMSVFLVDSGTQVASKLSSGLVLRLGVTIQS